MRPIFACFFLCLLLLQFDFDNCDRISHLSDVVIEETDATEFEPLNYIETLSSEYLYHHPIENYTGKGYSSAAYSTFDLPLLTSGVAFVELRPPDQPVS